MAIQPFQLPYSESAVRDLRERLAHTRWPDTISGSGWEYGFDLAYLQRICRYWREEFDWKAEIGRLAFQSLWKLINDSSQGGADYEVQTSLVIRQTTAPPPAVGRPNGLRSSDPLLALGPTS